MVETVQTRSILHLLTAAAVAVGSMAAASPARAQVETTEYTVQEGDTCESIADEYYDHEGGCELIEKYNTSGGEAPSYEAGEVLELPTKVVKPEAHVDQRYGPVRSREPDREWESAVVGQELFESWRVNTLDTARAQLGFRDRSELKMREQTLVIIYGGSREKTQRTRQRAELEEGKLRSRLSELSGEESLQIDTPSARAEANEGEGFYDVEKDGTTRVANHGGEPIEVAGKGSAAAQKTVTVREGMGTQVERGKPPSPPEELPPAPEWKPRATGRLSLGGEPVRLAAAWESVDEASEYFVELAADPEGIEIVESAYVSADITQLEVQELPPGTYYATVSTIDADEFEGIPSERVEFRVFEVDYDPRSRVDGAEVPTFVVGSRLDLPRGVTCTTSDTEEPSGTVRLGVPGTKTLRCGEGNDREIDPLELRVARPDVSFGGPSFAEDRITVRETGFATVDLEFEPQTPDDLEVGLASERDLEGWSAEATPVTGRRLRVRVEAPPAASGRAELVVRVGEDLELARVPVAVEEAEGRRPSRRRESTSTADLRTVRAGLHVGGLGRIGSGVDETRWGGGGALVVSYLHHPAFALEALGGVDVPFGGGPMPGARVRAFGRLDGRVVQPYAGGGFGVSGEVGERPTPLLSSVVGAEGDLGSNWRIRGELGADFSVGAGGAGVWTPRFGVGILRNFR